MDTLESTNEITFDVDAVRTRFASLRANKFTYFDAPAGSQVPDEVGDAMAALMRTASGNIGGFDATSQTLAALRSRSRERAAGFFGGDAENIVFGASMTSLNFNLSRAAARDFVSGDEIIVTALDHDGNVAPWRELALDRGFVIRTCDLTEDLRIDVDHMRSLINDRTKVIAFPWAANTVGSIGQAAEITKIARDAGAISWVDAVHYAAHQNMDVKSIGADVVLCSAYKFCGPHLGMAHIEPRAADSWAAYTVSPQGGNKTASRFETGTLPYELLAGLCATFDYLDSLGGFAAIAPYEASVARHLLASIPEEVNVYGPALEQRVPTFLMTIPGVEAELVSRKLAEAKIGVWRHNFSYEVGLPPRLPFTGEAFRVGIAHYNTVDEIDLLCKALEEIIGAR